MADGSTNSGDIGDADGVEWPPAPARPSGGYPSIGYKSPWPSACMAIAALVFVAAAPLLRVLLHIRGAQTGVWTTGPMVATAVVPVLVIAWMLRIAWNVRLLDLPGPEPWYAALCFILPVVGLYEPCRMVERCYRACRSASRPAGRAPIDGSVWLIRIWWTVWLLSAALGSWFWYEASTPAAPTRTLPLLGSYVLSTVLAGVLLIAVLLVVTEAQTAAAQPYGRVRS